MELGIIFVFITSKSVKSSKLFVTLRDSLEMKEKKKYKNWKRCEKKSSEIKQVVPPRVHHQATAGRATRVTIIYDGCLFSSWKELKLIFPPDQFGWLIFKIPTFKTMTVEKLEFAPLFSEFDAVLWFQKLVQSKKAEKNDEWKCEKFNVKNVLIIFLIL